MKRWTLSAIVFSVAILLFSSTASAGMPIKQGGNFGIGFGVGTTAAPISLKYYMQQDLSVQGNIGWWHGGFFGGCHRHGRFGRCYGGGFREDSLGLSGDFLFEGPPLVGNQDISLDWEVGGGVGLGFSDVAFGFGIAFVAGLQVNIHAVPIDVVLEYRPSLHFWTSDFADDFYIDWFDLTPHIRYYF